MNSICIQIKQNRLHCQLTQRELAERSGVAYGTLRRLESTGQGSLKDYFQLQAVFDQSAPANASDATRPDMPLHAPAHPIAQRVRKRRVPLLPSSNTTLALKAELIESAPMQPASEQQHSALSKKISLDFPYDWSNPNISEEALIAKVLDEARFMDVSRVFAYFGHARVKAVAEDFSIDLEHGVLGALMPGIERGASYA